MAFSGCHCADREQLPRPGGTAVYQLCTASSAVCEYPGKEEPTKLVVDMTARCTGVQRPDQVETQAEFIRLPWQRRRLAALSSSEQVWRQPFSVAAVEAEDPHAPSRHAVHQRSPDEVDGDRVLAN